MIIRKYILVTAVALSTFALSCIVVAEYRSVTSFLTSERLDHKVAPLAEMDADALTNVEYSMPLTDEIDTAVVSPDAETANQYFDPTGSYLFSDFENPPRGFEDFEYIEIVTLDYETESTPGVYGTPIPPRGGIRAKRMYRFKTVAISPTTIAFETETVKGVSYRFVGTFPGDEVEESCAGTAANLTGQLTKTKNGKRITVKKAEFLIECGC